MAKKKKQASNMLEVQNAAKTLFANIRFMSPDNPIRSIVMTSSVPNEGKSTCSVELARAIATSGKTVLLVEADMRRRTLASLLNVRPAAGVYAVLTDAAPLKTAVTPTQTPNLFFLDVEPNIPNPADIISSKRYQKLVATLEDSYDYVIYDMPPVGTFVDAAILSTLLDEAFRAGGRVRAAEEGRCQHPRHLRHVLRRHRFRILLRVLYQGRRTVEGRRRCCRAAGRDAHAGSHGRASCTPRCAGQPRSCRRSRRIR